MTEEVKDVLDDFGKAFEDFKVKHEQNIEEIKKNGVADPLLQEQVDKLANDVAKVAEQKQELDLKAEAIEDAKSRIEAIETKLARPEMSNNAESSLQMKAFEKYVRAKELDPEEKKALYESDDTLGGFYAPTEYVEEILKTITEFSPMRSIVKVRQTTKRGIEIPKRVGTFTAQWVGETATRSETTGYTTGLVSIDAKELYALVDISQSMLEDSAFNMESEMADEFGTQFAVAEGQSIVAGDGIDRPLGITDSTAGVGSTNSGNGTALTANGLLDLVFAIKSDYLRNARFVFNRSTFAKILQLEDGEGQKIFHQGLNLVGGAPSTIVGYGYTIAKDMPDVGAGAKPIAFGDFARAYCLVDRTNMSIVRDPFTQNHLGNVRYTARRRVGGTVVIPEAIRLQNISA